ncbi:hypothetical protein [Arsenicibacter rosenii]|uniref:Phosphatidic acid phosphatase type 2/haloperoxidase domain-containing protein n=1 Tax=Arsenicibacter rosenii TaxID=1750698 RepID=A0A1S2VEI9_9BACT|nr:hypothetical protein [Arsenicibacter rosenii]OIN56606.1 hypothetical protein BLX24_23945 [Arsenicibacter rosenii]
MPTWLFGILLYQVPVVLGLDTFSVELRIRLLVLILIGTFAIPSLLIYFLFRSGYVQSLHLDDRLDRRLPYLITGFVYSFLTFLFAFRMQLISDVAPEIAIILGSITMSILLVGIISLFWKISAHGVGIGGSLGAVAGIVLKFSETGLVYTLALLILLAGVVLSARLQLNAHTPSQAGAGLFLGILVSLTAVFLYV